MIRIIRTAAELEEYRKEIRNRQYETNPVTASFSDDWEYMEPYNFDKEYIKVTRVDNHETIERVSKNNIVLEYLRYPHIFNVMGIPEDKIYL